jgi:hypothetical protein
LRGHLESNAACPTGDQNRVARSFHKCPSLVIWTLIVHMSSIDKWTEIVKNYYLWRK